MKTITLLQVGDVHFPDTKFSIKLDQKDSAFPQPIAERIEVDPFRVCLRWLANECEEGVDGLILCGDMTSRADMKAYQSFASHIINLLELKDSSKWSFDQIHVVPGNHDIERKFTKTDEDIYKKFEKLKSIWKDLGVDVLAFDNVRMTTVANGTTTLRVYSLNSCIGCGEKRFFPDKVRSDLVEILERYSKKSAPDEAFDLVGEELDTPAFDRSHVEDMSFDLNKRTDNNASVVVSHHNLLPQSIPRVALYTEAVNSGFLRSELVKIQNPILYCHGHIHSDPIEIVKDPTGKMGILICISAPEVVKGFNKIKIFFNKQGISVGCRVVRCKVDGNAINSDEEISIPFYDPGSCDEVCDERMFQLVRSFGREYIRFSSIKDKYKDAFGVNPRDNTLKHWLEEAEWYGLVRINDRDKKFTYWQIRGVL